MNNCNNKDYVLDLSKLDLILEDEGIKLKIWYVAKGTRSEGIHGVLEGFKFLNSQQDKIETSLGTLMFYGEWEQRKHLFSKSGWLPEKLEGIYPNDIPQVSKAQK